MTQIQIVNAMNQSVVNKLTSFNNQEIKKEELNKFLFINLTYILKKKKEINSKNDKIKKEQEKEIKKSLSKIKTYCTEKMVFNSEELENKPIMKKMINQSLELYIPLSEISYTTEIKFYNEKCGYSIFNESILFQNIEEEKEKEINNDDKKIIFKEAPISFNKFVIEKDKDKYKENYFDHVNENFVDLINNFDEDTILKKDDNDQYNTNLFNELINSFDEGDKEDPDLDKENKENKESIINPDFKDIKSNFYFDDVFTRKSSKRSSRDIYNYITLSTISDSTSFGSGSNSLSLNHQTYLPIYESEFASYLSYEAFKKNIKKMNVDYLRYMLVIYNNYITKSKKWFYSEEKMFINLIKNFVLKIGISSKKLYEKFFQNLINIKLNSFSFEKFLKFFSQILKFKEENIVLKYKFIIYLLTHDEEDINIKHINIFFQLIKGEAMFDINLWDELNKGLISRYDKIYDKNSENNFRFDKMIICLESFFDKDGKFLFGN